MSSAYKTAAIVSLTAVAGFAIYSMLSPSKAGGKDSELAPALTEDETKLYMEAILLKTQMLAAKMARAADNIRQQLQANGQGDVDDMQLMKAFILPHFDTEFQKEQQSVLDEFDVDEDDLEEATNEYIRLGNKDLKSISAKLRRIYQTFGGEVGEIEEEVETSSGSATQKSSSSSSSAPSSSSGSASSGKSSSSSSGDGSESHCLAILTQLAEKLLENTEKFTIAFKEEYGIPTTPNDFGRFQQGLLVITEGVEKQLLDENDLTQMAFQQLLMKHQESPSVQQTVMQMQYRNQMILQMHGINMGQPPQ